MYALALTSGRPSASTVRSAVASRPSIALRSQRAARPGSAPRGARPEPVERRADVVEPDRVAPRERAARVVEAEREAGVHVVRRADALATAKRPRSRAGRRSGRARGRARRRPTRWEAEAREEAPRRPRLRRAARWETGELDEPGLVERREQVEADAPGSPRAARLLAGAERRAAARPGQRRGRIGAGVDDELGRTALAERVAGGASALAQAVGDGAVARERIAPRARLAPSPPPGSPRPAPGRPAGTGPRCG